jgi:hypothetical protein
MERLFPFSASAGKSAVFRGKYRHSKAFHQASRVNVSLRMPQAGRVMYITAYAFCVAQHNPGFGEYS